jgi:acetolactate synthase-1/2/3 large subunit
MLEDWPAPAGSNPVPSAPKSRPGSEAIAEVAGLLSSARNPVIVTESCGRDAAAFQSLQELADLAAIPVVETGTPTYANFPKTHPMHQGLDLKPHLDQADLFLVVCSSVPWYPPSAGPSQGTVVVIDENPLKGHMTYQNLRADIYLEGDVSVTLRLLAEAVCAMNISSRQDVKARRERWEAQHNKLQDGTRAAAEGVSGAAPIDPAWLCTAISDVFPEETIYVEETITHRRAIQRHVQWSHPHSYFHPTGGLGMGLGQALGVKLAAPDRPVAALMGDGSFLYNPVVPALGLARDYGLPILIVLFNNGSYSAMKGSHLDFYPGGIADTSGVFHGTDISGFDYPQLVEPFGGYGERIEDPKDLKPALQRGLAAVNRGQTALLDVVLAR